MTTRLLLGVIAASLVWCVGIAPARQPEKAWTILVYAAADNNADGPVLEFLDGVRRAIDDDPGIDLLLLIDRSEGYSRDAKLLGEDFTGARLFRLRRDTSERLSGGPHFPQITAEKDAEIDSADAANVGRFIAWGKAESPARRYALLIYSHADGRTMCPDEKGDTHMGIAELTDEVGPAEHVDFLALELCNMGGLEIAYQWRPGNGRFGADVLLAIPNAGPPLDWHLAFGRIRSPGRETAAGRPPVDPNSMTAADFGMLVIEEGYAGRLAAEERGRASSGESAAAYDLAQAASVKEAVDAFARALAKQPVTSLEGLRSGLMTYAEHGLYVDLYDLCAKTAAQDGSSEDVRAAATKVMARVDRLVLASFGMGAYKGFIQGQHGVFIVFPDRQQWSKSSWYTPREHARAYGRWSFLSDGATEDNGVVENWFEVLDSWYDDPAGGANGCRP